MAVVPFLEILYGPRDHENSRQWPGNESPLRLLLDEDQGVRRGETPQERQSLYAVSLSWFLPFKDAETGEEIRQGLECQDSRSKLASVRVPVPHRSLQPD